MSLPVYPQNVEKVLVPSLGSAFTETTGICEDLAADLALYSPARMSLEELQQLLHRKLLMAIHTQTRGRLKLALDNGGTQVVSDSLLNELTDGLMGMIFALLSPSSANFLNLSEYSMHVQSLNAMRTLYERFHSFYSDEEYAFLTHMIRTIYPPESYSSWLKES